MMMNKFLGIVSIIAFLHFSLFSVAQAQEESEGLVFDVQLTPPEMPDTSIFDPQDPPDGAIIQPLRRGSRADFDGVLLNNEAHAFMIAEFEYIQQRWSLRLERHHNLVVAWSERQIQSLLLQQQYQEESYELRIESLQENAREDREIIEELESQVGWTFGEKTITFTLTLSALVLGGGLGYLFGKLAN